MAVGMRYNSRSPFRRLQNPKTDRLLVDVGGLDLDGERYARGLLNETGVAVVPGYAFGDCMDSFVRIGFLRDEATLIEAAARITNFTKSVGTK